MSAGRLTEIRRDAGDAGSDHPHGLAQAVLGHSEVQGPMLAGGAVEDVDVGLVVQLGGHG